MKLEDRSPLKVGDIVQLRSGGPNMTVAFVTNEGLACSWFEGRRHHEKIFVGAALQRQPELPAGVPDIILQFVRPDGSIAFSRKLSDMPN